MRSGVAVVVVVGLAVAGGLGGCSGESVWQSRAEDLAGANAECSEPRVCGELVYVNCLSEADGPSFFFDRVSGDLISRCGGACFVPSGPQIEVCATLCPPPGWDCPFQ